MTCFRDGYEASSAKQRRPFACTQQLTDVSVAASTLDYDHRPAIIPLQGEPRTLHRVDLIGRRGRRWKSDRDEIGCGAPRYTCTKSRYLQSESRCRSKLGEAGPRAERPGAAPIGRSSRRERTGERGGAREKEGKGENGLAALWVDFAAGRPPHLRRSCRTNVLAFWPGRVGVRGRGRGGAPRTR